MWHASKIVSGRCHMLHHSFHKCYNKKCFKLKILWKIIVCIWILWLSSKLLLYIYKRFVKTNYSSFRKIGTESWRELICPLKIYFGPGNEWWHIISGNWSQRYISVLNLVKKIWSTSSSHSVENLASCYKHKVKSKKI